MSSKGFPGTLRRDIGLKFVLSVAPPFVKTGLTLETFQADGQ